jgi:PRTRC genetic system ThiF family protein
MKHPLRPHFLQRPLNIGLAGAGGNGSQMLGGLARLHTALCALGHPGLHVVVYDPDHVTPANLGRQLFSAADLGCNKAQVLVNRINCFFNLQWRPVPAKLTRRSGQEWDFLIGCVDSAAARLELDRCNFHYWLDLGNSTKFGQVILGECSPNRVPKRSRPEAVARSFGRKMTSNERKEHQEWLDWKVSLLPNVLGIFPQLKRKRRHVDNTPSCSLAEALEKQDLFINQSVATFALQLLWQFIRKGGLNIHGYFINLETGRVTPLPIMSTRNGNGHLHDKDQHDDETD